MNNLFPKRIWKCLLTLPIAELFNFSGLVQESLAYIVPKAYFDELLVLWRQYIFSGIEDEFSGRQCMRFDKNQGIIFSSIGKQTATSNFNQALSLFCTVAHKSHGKTKTHGKTNKAHGKIQ